VMPWKAQAFRDGRASVVPLRTRTLGLGLLRKILSDWRSSRNSLSICCDRAGSHIAADHAGRRVSTTLRQSAKEFSEYSFLENPMRRVC
jgi:hypothetical protein